MFEGAEVAEDGGFWWIGDGARLKCWRMSTSRCDLAMVCVTAGLGLGLGLV